jgi:DNA-binding IclR family transcriptional regulator
LGVNQGAHTFVLRTVEAVRGVPIVQPVAVKLPIPQVAIGKAILAFTAPDRFDCTADQLFPEPGEKHSREAFCAEIKRARVDRYASRLREGQNEPAGVAVPIFDRTGYAVAGLGVAVEPNAPGGESLETVLSIVRDIAATVSRYLGHTKLAAMSIP